MMAEVSISHGVPELWTALMADRRQKRLLSDDFAMLRNSCEISCGKKHLVECPDCYNKALERIRIRYSNAEEREWISQRRAFSPELEALFERAKEQKTSLEHIEQRVESEKVDWYRWILQSRPEFFLAADSRVDLEELRAMLDDRSRSVGELLAMTTDAMREAPDVSEQVEEFVAKVSEIEKDAPELKKLYINEFFKDKSSGEVLEDAQQFLDVYEATDDMIVEDIMEKIIQAIKNDRSAQPQRESHQRRLDEIRRAKTAFEQNKAATKGRPQGAQTAVAGEELYSLPPCEVCRREVNPKEVLSCSICQTVTQMGGEKRLTVYCSRRCFYEGHVCDIEWSLGNRADSYRMSTPKSITNARQGTAAYRATGPTWRCSMKVTGPWRVGSA